MKTLKCTLCQHRTAESEALLLDVGLSFREYISGEPGAFRNDAYVLCPKCTKDVSAHLCDYQNILIAALAGRAYVFPVRLPRVGESVFEVIDGGPIIENIVTKIENGRYCAVAKAIKEAGEISFTPCDLGYNLFLTKKAAQAEKSRRAREDD